MNTRNGLKLAIIATVLVLLVISAAVQPASAGAFQTGWMTDTIYDETSLTTYSTVFGGPNQIPIISVQDGESLRTMRYYGGGVGNCAQGSDWLCNNFGVELIEDNSLSDMAAYTFTNTFKIAWVYPQTNNTLAYLYMELNLGGSLLDWGTETIYDLPDGSSFMGRPSLAFDDYGNAHIAVVIHTTASLVRTLKYIHHTGSTNTSCGLSNHYTCETILGKSAMQGGLGSYPKIVVNGHNEPQILYYDGVTDYLSYAYPQDLATYHPNCGPGGNTWRCVGISNMVQSASDMDLAIGPNTTRPQLAWTNEDGMSQTWVHHAKYVGWFGNGNCGEDYIATPGGIQLQYAWECHQTAEVTLNALYAYVSIQVDDDNQPVIAFNTGDTFFELGVLYGTGPGEYIYQEVDSPPFNTGRHIDLALSDQGRGFIAYIDDEEYSPSLRFALQDFGVYLPVTKR